MELQPLHEIIEAAQSGSAEAYNVLLERYGRRLYGYFFRATGNHHEAEDLLGELVLRLVRRLAHYDDRGRFEPWLFRIAANMVRDRIRHVRIRPRMASLSAEDPDSGIPAGDRLAGNAPDVDEAVLANEMSEDLHRALARLDDTTRQMILLRHFGEMSFKEIANLCQAPLGTVLARVHRGLKTLRAIMGKRKDG